MSENRNYQPQRRSQRDGEFLGWLKEFLSQFELAWKLLWDARVPTSTKLVPILTLAYLLLPIDIVPDAFIGLGQVDDLMILMVGLRMFISLSPAAVVAEYQRLTGGAEDAVWGQEEDIIDLEAEQPDKES